MYKCEELSEHLLQSERILMQNRISENLLKAEIFFIYWERINLHLKLKLKFNSDIIDKECIEFFLVNRNYMAKAKFTLVSVAEDNYEIMLNITNSGYCRCLSEGDYRILICSGNNIWNEPMINGEVISLLKEKSRCFFYNNREKIYNVDFSLNSEMEKLYLRLSVGNYKVDELSCNVESEYYKRRTFSIIKNKIKNSLIIYLYRIYSSIYKRFGNHKNNILFLTEQSPVLGRNLQSIYSRIEQRGLDKKFKIMISTRDSVKKKGKLGKKSWIRLIIKLAKADYIFLDDHCPVFNWLFIRSDVKIIQLWHAGAGFKSSGYSRWGNEGCVGIISGHRQYDYGITCSEKTAHFFSEVFGINEEQILPSGMPRMDKFLETAYQSECIKKIYDKYPLLKNKKVILFAPTYRGQNSADAYYPYEVVEFEKLYDFCSTEYVVIFKMHPWVKEAVPIKECFKDRLFDFNDYQDINELFYITDLLITDYSSNIFEYSLMRKPMLFFAFDMEQYVFSRGFHRNYEENVPGKIVKSFSDLISSIKKSDFEYEKGEHYIEEHFDNIDSKASDRVIDWFLLDNIPDKYRLRIKTRELENKRIKNMDFSEINHL